MRVEMSSTDRRLPVYLVLDCSGSMFGNPIEAVRGGLRQLLNDLNDDPYALETVWLSIITFDSQARQVVPLTELRSVQMPAIEASGTTALGGALRLLLDCVEREVRKGSSAEHKGDWKPLVFLMTDGMPTDDWESVADQVKQRKFGNIIACAAGEEAKDDVLKRITNTVVRLKDTSPGTLGAFMDWVTQSITRMSASVNQQGDVPVQVDIPEDKGIELVP